MSYFRVVAERYPARQVMKRRVLPSDSKTVRLDLSCSHVVHRPRFGLHDEELLHETAHCEHCPKRKCAKV